VRAGTILDEFAQNIGVEKIFHLPFLDERKTLGA
jgi:hypothetical protein